MNGRGNLGPMVRLSFYSSYSPDRWYNIGGPVLGVGRWNGGYIRNLPLLPFGVPIAPTDLRVGGPAYPKFGVVVDLSSILDNFVFDF